MLRKDKIKLLQQMAKGDSSGLYQINKSLSVVFITMVNNEGYWIEYFSFDPNKKDVDIDNLTTDEILNDPSIRKYTSTELRMMQKRRFIFAMPPELLNYSDEKIMEFYNKHFAKDNE